ncbi:MAG: hypothetical protein WCD56_13295, partial [Pseudolabrys sp.]
CIGCLLSQVSQSIVAGELELKYGAPSVKFRARIKRFVGKFDPERWCRNTSENADQSWFQP